MAPLALIPQLTEWWQGLDTIGQVFVGIGGIAGFVTVILLVLTVFGLDHGGIADSLDVDTEIHGDGSLFSLRSVTAFFLGFGWTGYLVYKHSGNILFACLAGFVVGTIFMLIVFWIGKSLMKLQSDGTIDYNQAIGSTGTVYVTIPGNRQSSGQAQVSFKQRHEVINAVTDAQESLSAGTNIRVKERLANNLFLVEPL
ncbi:MAG: hypothetical protein LBV12_05060 [Puniceicoccales bacterium]|jgi:hypothetical protein|nr:hypothetical protein [Puniceicoccales bacterium]